MNPSDENQAQSKGEDSKFQDELQKGPTAPENPPVPMIPEDIDDDDEGLPLITSVFSLATSDEPDSPENKTSQKKDAATSTLLSPPSKTSTSPTESSKLGQSSSFRVQPKPSASQVNVPFYVGKGKLLLPKTEEGKISLPTQAAGVTFSKMVSIQPITTSARNTSTTDATKSGTSMLTRGALKKIDLTNTSGHANTGSTVSAHTTSGSPGAMINLSTSVPFLSMQSANAQITVPPLNTATPASNTTLSVTNPLVQMVKRIAPATTVTTPNQSSTVAKSHVTTIPMSKQLVAPAAQPQQQKSRHVNIAPAPSTTSVFVVVSKTLPSPTTANTTVTTNLAGSHTPRVVTATKAVKPSQVPVSPGQLMYLIENKTADGKIYRFLIPTDNAKILTNPANNSKTITVVTSKAPTTPQPPTPSATLPAPAPTQHVRIIPKPLQTTVSTQKSQPQTTTVSTVSSGTTAAGLKPGVSNPVVTASRPVMLNSVTPPAVTSNATPYTSTSPTITTSPITEEDSMSSPPTSPAPTTEECPSEDDSIDSGLSPHEARIQKLKDLLRKQEDAVNRLREKRKKEIEDVRATSSSETTAAKRDSPFAVPLPPKKAKHELYRRNKAKDTNTQTSKDGFLPNTDDTHFVKLVGLEKVVDKIKAKKILELSENSKVSE